MKKIIGILLVLCAAQFVWSNEIAFHIMQHSNTLKDVAEQTFIIEDTILDYFFDLGDIVTNERAACVSEKDVPKTTQESLKAAQEGGADYFVLIELFYNDDMPLELDAVSLLNISKTTYTVFDAVSGKKLSSKKQKTTAATKAKTNIDGVKEYAVRIAAHIRKDTAKKEK